MGHLAHACWKAARLRGGTAGKSLPHQQPQRSEMKCFNCGQKGHFSYRYPRNAALFCRTSQQTGGWLDTGEVIETKGCHAVVQWKAEQ